MGVLHRLLGIDHRVDETPDLDWPRDALSVEKQNKNLTTTIDYSNDTYKIQRSDSTDGSWTAAYGRSPETGELRVFVLDSDALVWTDSLDHPFACSIANNGWSAFLSRGDVRTLTNELRVLRPDGSVSFTDVKNSTLCALQMSPDGRYVAVVSSKPDAKTYIYDTTTCSIRTIHQNERNDLRLIAFHRVSGEWRVYLSAKNAASPLYAINTNGQLVWKSERLHRRTPFYVRLLKDTRRP